MAVIDALPQVKVFVRIAGDEHDCTEYDDPDPPRAPAQCGVATHTSSKVIESKDDAEFLLRYEMENSLGWFDGDKGITMKLFIDGNCVRSSVCKRSDLVGQTITCEVPGARVLGDHPGQWLLRNFKFSSIATVEGRENQLHEDKAVAKHLGIIEVCVYRVVCQGVGRGSQRQVHALSALGEKALKGKNLSHGTAFSDGYATEPRASFKCHYSDGRKKSLARFFFRYKCRAALQIDGIIPNETSPEEHSPSPLSVTVRDMSRDELEVLAQERLNQIKVEAAQRSGAGIKREASADNDERLRKIFKVDEDGIIDLTDD